MDEFAPDEWQFLLTEDGSLGRVLVDLEPFLDFTRWLNDQLDLLEEQFLPLEQPPVFDERLLSVARPKPARPMGQG